jgi:hypothetical protein
MGSGATRYTFTPDPQFRPGSITVDVARDIERHRYTGVTFTGGRLSFGTGDRHFGMSLSCIGCEESAVSGLPELTETEIPVPEAIGETGATTPFDLTISDGVTTWTASAESIDVSATWDRRLRFVSRSLTPVGVTGGGVVGADAKVKWFYDGDTDFLLDAIRARTEVSMTLTMQGAVIGGGIYEGLEITLPRCLVNGDPPTLRGSGFGNIDFTASLAPLYSSSAGYGPLRYRVTVPSPSITSIVPATGLTPGGETITITGAHFL